VYGSRECRYVLDQRGSVSSVPDIVHRRLEARKSSFLGGLLQRGGDKLEGRRAFDFSVNLPETIEFKAGAQYGLTEFPLPSSFAEPSARASVSYEIALTVKRGTLSTVDS
jgi:hypothetical protein